MRELLLVPASSLKPVENFLNDILIGATILQKVADHGGEERLVVLGHSGALLRI